jgi:biopolymer transport protein ExbD
VFFALTTATIGELAPVVSGVTLPEAHVGSNALQQLTLGVGRQVTLAGTVVMNTIDAAQAQSTMPDQPLVIPALYSVLHTKADSIRTATLGTPDQPVSTPLAIQGDRTMRYDLLSRIMQTARIAGFKNISLQVKKVTSGA